MQAYLYILLLLPNEQAQRRIYNKKPKKGKKTSKYTTTFSFSTFFPLPLLLLVLSILVGIVVHTRTRE